MTPPRGYPRGTTAPPPGESSGVGLQELPREANIAGPAAGLQAVIAHPDRIGWSTPACCPRAGSWNVRGREA